MNRETAHLLTDINDECLKKKEKKDSSSLWDYKQKCNRFASICQA